MKIIEILKNLDGYELEGGGRYYFHRDGCEVAPTFTIKDAMTIIRLLYEYYVISEDLQSLNFVEFKSTYEKFKSIKELIES